MTIRDLLSINSAWFNDYITINKDDEKILKLIPIKELHPIWLEYEVEKYFLLPHEEDSEGIETKYSTVNCDYIITISGVNIFQDKTTEIDKALNERLEDLIERIKDNESTNND